MRKRGWPENPSEVINIFYIGSIGGSNAILPEFCRYK
jgi:hypothetical protein